MLYQNGKRLLHLFLNQFFAEIRIVGDAPIEEGPLLVVSNHPNHAMDPFLVTKTFSRDLWFISRGDIFQKPIVSWFLKAAHLVPVYSREEREEDPSLSNESTFQFSTETLLEKKAIVIFPEGMSRNVRTLHPVRSGAARMALQAEVSNHDRLGLKIQPLGLTYMSMRQFQSTVTVNVGPPIELDSYTEEFRVDSEKAVERLTDRIEQDLKKIIVEVENEDHDVLLHKVAKLFASKAYERNDFARLNEIASAIEALAPRFPEKRREIESALDQTFLSWDEWGISGEKGIRPRASLLLLSPFVGIGYVINALPYFIVGPLARKLNTHPGGLAVAKFSTGIFVFAAWYLLISLVLFLITDSFCIGILTFCGLIIFGVLTNRALHDVKISLLALLRPSIFYNLSRERDRLIEEIESLRASS